MSDIQRYDGEDSMGDVPSDTGRFVLHADHVEALRQARLADSLREGERATREYERGQRDALAAAVQRVNEIDTVEWALNPYPSVIDAIKGEQA